MLGDKSSGDDMKTYGYVIGISGEVQPSVDLLADWIISAMEAHSIQGEVDVEALGEIPMGEDESHDPIGEPGPCPYCLMNVHIGKPHSMDCHLFKEFKFEETE